MRKILMTAVCTVALTLTACTDTSETYKVGVSDTWSTLTSSGYSASAFALPSGLMANDVRASFESFPGDRTGYWKFTRKGKELARINVAVEGDEASSTVSYSYAKGDVSEEDKKYEVEVRKYSPMLVVEAIDSTIEKRDRDQNLKNVADAKTAMALMGNMMREANASMDKAIKEMKAGDAASAQASADSAARSAKYTSTKPTTDLSGF